MNTYFIRYQCNPLPESGNARRYVGAFICGWILADNLDNAIAIYTHSVKDNDWFPVIFKDGYQVKRDDYFNGQEEREYFDHAQDDGEAYLVDSWTDESGSSVKIH